MYQSLQFSISSWLKYMYNFKQYHFDTLKEGEWLNDKVHMHCTVTGGCICLLFKFFYYR